MTLLPPQLSQAKERRLWQAYHDDDLATIRSILEPLVAKPDTDVCQFRRITALHLAARFGMDDLVDCLIAGGADVNQDSIGGMGDVVGETPLQEACLGGHASTCMKLIDAGACVSATQRLCRIGGFVRDALAIAADGGHLPIVELLLEAGADPDGSPPPAFLDVDRVSLLRPLPVAIIGGHVQVSARLIRAGADVDLESAHVQFPYERTSARQWISASDDPEIRALL